MLTRELRRRCGGWSAGGTFESLPGHFNSFRVPGELGARRLSKRSQSSSNLLQIPCQFFSSKCVHISVEFLSASTNRRLSQSILISFSQLLSGNFRKRFSPPPPIPCTHRPSPRTPPLVLGDPSPCWDSQLKNQAPPFLAPRTPLAPSSKKIKNTRNVHLD